VVRLVAWVLAGVCAAAPAAHAHPLAPALLELQEHAGGHVDVGWKRPLMRPPGDTQAFVLPSRCTPVGDPAVSQEGGGVWTRWVIDCGPGGLVGERIAVTGGGGLGIGALVRVTLADGRVVERVLTPAHPELTVPAEPRIVDVVRDYARLGIEHILTGPDHLLFVFGLVLLAGTTRHLLATITAFTFGHSITLTLAALGIVDLPSRAIEAGIAASVLALAVELARRPAHPTLMRRRPWLMAATFGLLHGLGFAAALRDAGLPAGAIPLALFAFNLGIEIGQVLFVLVVLAAGRILGRVAGEVPAWARRVPLYVMGSLAASWWLERTLALLR